MRRSIIAAFSFIALAGCQTTSADLDPVEVAEGKRLLLKHCVVENRRDDVRVSSQEIDQDNQAVYVQNITAGEDGWTRYGVSYRGFLDNVYVNKAKNRVICGARNWKAQNHEFRPLPAKK